jgi:NAD-dependent deacetylase
VLKPKVILFGEQLPVQELVKAQLSTQVADLILVAGSSLEVAPASNLPELALQHGAKLIIVNYQPTYLDSRADLVIRANVAEVLPGITELVRV